MSDHGLFLDAGDDGWRVGGDDAGRFALVNEYLSYLADRNYSPRTIRTYGFGLLAFWRWLDDEGLDLSAVTTDVLFQFLAACRAERVAGWPGGPNVVGLDGRRTDTVSPATVKLRLAAISGVFSFASMRGDPDIPNLVPKGREAKRLSAGERTGMLAHV